MEQILPLKEIFLFMEVGQEVLKLVENIKIPLLYYLEEKGLFQLHNLLIVVTGMLILRLMQKLIKIFI